MAQHMYGQQGGPGAAPGGDGQAEAPPKDDGVIDAEFERKS
jgi:hypothetical protein